MESTSYIECIKWTNYKVYFI